MAVLEGNSHQREWGLSALLIVQTVTLFVVIPFGENYFAAHLVIDICRLAFAAVCITVLTHHRWLQATLLLFLVVLIGGPIIGRNLISHLGIEDETAFLHGLIRLIAFVFTSAVTAIVARHVFGPGRVTFHRVQGAVLIYLNAAALFAIAFSVIVSWWPEAITLAGTPLGAKDSEQTAILTYFSLSTLTTTGYGDVVPVHPIARSLANLEAVIGQLFPATLLARIVALNLEHAKMPGKSRQASGDKSD